MNQKNLATTSRFLAWKTQCKYRRRSGGNFAQVRCNVAAREVTLLIVAGALARAGKMNLTFAVTVAFIAVILADLFWYSLGRCRGGRIMKLLCRISLEPDSCVLTAKQNSSIVDLRQPTDIEAFPQMIPGALRILWKRSKSATERFPGIATSFSTARDPTKRPAPVWRCSCEPKESPAFARSKAGSTLGSRTISLSSLHAAHGSGRSAVVG